MKRIIQCSKCEAKLSVFDTGKPINQKCPKCGNSITLDSTNSSDEDKQDDKAATSDKTPEPEKDGKTAEADKPAENKDGSTESKTPDKPGEGKEGSKAEKTSDKPAEGKDGAKDGKASDKLAEDKDAPKDGKASDKPTEGKDGAKESKASDKPAESKDDAKESKKSDKKPQTKTTPVSSAALDDLDSLHIPETAGTGGLSKAIVIGALVIIIIMQMITKRSADKQYKTLIEHLQYIEKNLVK
jgi:phage FluMu protein Com